MLSFVQNWFAPRANPIGVDFGSDCLRLAQVQWVGNDHKLVAAASADVPSHVKQDVNARLAFFVETARDLLSQGNFRTRQAILSMPASCMHIQHLRLGKMDDEQTRKALPWEARGKLPIDPSQALLRHIIAGEVYQDQELKNEVIVMAAAREFVNQLLSAAAKAKLDVVGMNVEPKAIVDCFEHVYRRKTDADMTNLFLDIGATGSRAIIARHGQICFARAIPIGGDHFNVATAHALRITLEEAKLLRLRLAQTAPVQPVVPEAPAKPAVDTGDNSFALLQAGLQAGKQEHPVVAATPPGEPQDQARLAEQACREPLNKLIEELDLCRRYYESTFPNKPVDRLIFVGGEAAQRALCQHVARELGLAAQVGDPLVRMGRVSELGIESGIDRRQPQPGWTVAIGLSMGPVGSNKPVAAEQRA